MLVTLIDGLFMLVGLIAVAFGFAVRKKIPQPEEAPTGSIREFILTVMALPVAAAGPNILVVALTPGLPEMHLLGRWVLLPSLIVFAAVLSLAYRFGYTRLTNRIWTGIWVGAAVTACLDAVRLTGFLLNLMPGNMPRMFGVLLLNRMALGPSLLSDLLGYLYHYWVGACLGLTYTLLLGRTRWWGALIWGLIIEIGMMVTPPMVVAMDTGYFGLKHGYYWLLTVSMIAHVVYGTMMGLLLERYLRHKGAILSILKQPLPASAIARPVSENLA